jgi:hypothetical protein
MCPNTGSSIRYELYAETSYLLYKLKEDAICGHLFPVEGNGISFPDFGLVS